MQLWSHGVRPNLGFNLKPVDAPSNPALRPTDPLPANSGTVSTNAELLTSAQRSVSNRESPPPTSMLTSPSDLITPSPRLTSTIPQSAHSSSGEASPSNRPNIPISFHESGPLPRVSPSMTTSKEPYTPTVRGNFLETASPPFPRHLLPTSYTPQGVAQLA